MYCEVMMFFCVTESRPLEFLSSQTMESAFSQLLAKFLEEFQKPRPYGPSLIEVRLWCVKYCQCYHHEESDFNVTSMEELFIKISQLEHCNFLNLGLLESLADTSKNKCLILSLKNYNDTFCYVKIENHMTRIHSYKVVKGEYRKKKYDVVLTKLIKRGMTYGELRNFAVTLSNRILWVQSNSVIRRHYKLGCFCIIWLIPSCLSDAAYYAASINTEVFGQLQIQYIMIGEHMIKPFEVYKRGMYVYILKLHFMS